MNAVLPRFHGLDRHYRSMGQGLARGEDNQRAVQRRFSGSQQQKGAERDKPTKKHRLARVFHFPEATWNAIDRCTADKLARDKEGPKVPRRLAACVPVSK